MEDVKHERQQVSPVQSTAAGLAAFVGGDEVKAIIRHTVVKIRAGVKVLSHVQVPQ